MNFLPVGHTHEDIDAFFGVFSKFLEKLDVYTIEGKQFMQKSLYSRHVDTVAFQYIS